MSAPRRLSLPAFGSILVMLLAGCTAGPEYRLPVVDTGGGWAGDPAAESVPDAAAAGPSETPADLARWWRTFEDPTLERLVERALEQNLDLRRATVRIAEARALREVVAGRRLPAVSVRGSVRELRQSENGQLPIDQIPRLERDQTLFDAGFDASWEADLAGRTRRALEASGARELEVLEMSRDLRVRVAAEVARAYFGLRGAQHRLATLDASLAAAERTHELVRRQVEAGEVAAASLARTETGVAALEARRPALEAEARTFALALGTLLGDLPESELALLEKDREPVALAPFPAGERADVLRRRPDVRAAERRLAAATAEIGVATAELFPRLSISASGGFQAMDLGDLLGSSSQTWQLVPFLSWRIFDRGRVRAEIRVAEARAEEAALAYEQAVLEALSDAEQALTRYRYGLETLARRERVVDSASRSYGWARERWRAGDVALLDVLDAERALRDAEDALALSHTRTATDLVALYKALGGGWEAPAETAVEPGQRDQRGSQPSTSRTSTGIARSSSRSTRSREPSGETS